MKLYPSTPRAVRRVATVAALVLAAGTLVLLVDYVAALLRAPADKSRIEELEQRVKTEDEFAAELHDERERQTNASLARKARSQAVAWVLLAAGAVFLVCAKRLMARRPPPHPTLDDLVAARFAAPAPAGPSAKTPPGPSAADEGIDLSFVDQLVERLGHDREAALPILQAIQAHYRYLPDAALRRVCELTEITPAQIAGNSSFYAQFRRSPVGRHVVRVCHGTACHVAGAEQITQELRRHLAIPPEEDTDPRRLFTIDAVACLGCCSLAPVIMVEEETVGRLTPAGARQALAAWGAPA